MEKMNVIHDLIGPCLVVERTTDMGCWKLMGHYDLRVSNVNVDVREDSTKLLNLDPPI